MSAWHLDCLTRSLANLYRELVTQSDLYTVTASGLRIKASSRSELVSPRLEQAIAVRRPFGIGLSVAQPRSRRRSASRAAKAVTHSGRSMNIGATPGPPSP